MYDDTWVRMHAETFAFCAWVGRFVEVSMSGQAVDTHEAREAEFVRLLTKHQPDIYLYLRSLTLAPEEVSDILQDTNLVLWENRGQFQMGTNFRAWAFQIVRYKLLQKQVQRRRGGVCFSEALMDELALQASRWTTRSMS